MIVVNYVFALLAIWGAAWVIADSKISLPVRLGIFNAKWIPMRLRILDFLECPACTSFWMGLAVGVLFLRLGWFSIAFGLMACGVSLVLFLVVKRFGGGE